MRQERANKSTIGAKLWMAFAACLFLVHGQDWNDNNNKSNNNDGNRNYSNIQEKDEKGGVVLNEPMIFGVSQGTTATHALYEATCNLNMITAHYFLVCMEGNSREDLTVAQNEAVKFHFEALDAYIDLKVCVRDDLFDASTCPINRVMQDMRSMRVAMDGLVKSGGVNAVHDSPYTLMSSRIIRAIERSRPFVEPILVLSERDPLVWAQKRGIDHASAILCRFFFGPEMDEYIHFMSLHCTPKNYSNNNKHHLHNYFDAFDLNCCVSFALHSNRSPKRARDIFTNYELLYHQAQGDVHKENQIIERNLIAFENYQSMYKQHNYLYYHVDLFAADSKMSTRDIAHDIYQDVIHSTNVTKKLDSQDSWIAPLNKKSTVDALHKMGFVDLTTTKSKSLPSNNIYNDPPLLKSVLSEYVINSVIDNYHSSLKPIEGLNKK